MTPSETPLTDEAELSNAHFSDWGTGPSGYVRRSDMERLELDRARLMEVASLLLSQYDASGDFTMGGKLTNKPFLMFAALLKELTC